MVQLYVYIDDLTELTACCATAGISESKCFGAIHSTGANSDGTKWFASHDNFPAALITAFEANSAIRVYDEQSHTEEGWEIE